MIITIALGVMLGLFLTGLVVHVLTEERSRKGLAWAFWIIVALIVLPMLNRVGWIVVGLLLGIFAVLVIITAVVEGMRERRRRIELTKKPEEQSRWPRIVKKLGLPGPGSNGQRWAWPMTLSCGHTVHWDNTIPTVMRNGRYSSVPQNGDRVHCSLCNPQHIRPDGRARQEQAQRREALRNLRALFGESGDDPDHQAHSGGA